MIGDTLYLDTPDEYEHLSKKVFAMLQWCTKHLAFRWLLKVDHDTYCRLDRVLPGIPAEADYGGRFWAYDPKAFNRSQLIGRCTDKSYEVLLAESWHGPWACGGGYFLSRRAAEHLAINAREHLYQHPVEDKAVADFLRQGDWAMCDLSPAFSNFGHRDLQSKIAALRSGVLTMQCNTEQLREIHAALLGLTVCLLHWRRPGHLRRILDRLAVQAPKPRIFLWDNSGKSFSHPAVDWHVNSSHNCLCPPRWWMAAHAETKFVASLDDDLLPADNYVFRDAVSCALRQSDDRVIGPIGAVLDPNRPYVAHQEVRAGKQDVAVDLVKGRCMLLRTAALREHLRLCDLLLREEDIAVCGALAANRRLHHLVPAILRGRFQNLPEGRESLSRCPGHAARREAARKLWFPSPIDR